MRRPDELNAHWHYNQPRNIPADALVAVVIIGLSLLALTSFIYWVIS